MDWLGWFGLAFGLGGTVFGVKNTRKSDIEKNQLGLLDRAYSWIEKLESTIEKLEETIAELRKELRLSDGKNEALERKIADLEDTLEVLKKQLMEAKKGKV